MVKKTATSAPAPQPDGDRKIDLTFLDTMGKVELEIEGTCGLLFGRFSQKVQQMLVRVQAGEIAKPAREVRDFDDECLESLHCLGKRPKTIKEMESGDFRFYVPSIAFKHAIVRAGTMRKIEMTKSRLGVFVTGKPHGCVEIFYKTPPEKAIHWVLGPNKKPDFRARAFFQDWRATITVGWEPGLFNYQELMQLIRIAGTSNGVGAYRVTTKNGIGEHGAFEIKSARMLVAPKGEQGLEAA